MYRRIYGLIDRYPKLKDKFNNDPMVYAALNSDGFVEEVLVNAVIALSDVCNNLKKLNEELIRNSPVTLILKDVRALDEVKDIKASDEFRNMMEKARSEVKDIKASIEKVRYEGE